MDISNDELDDILDSALEEFEEEELNEISKSIGSTIGKGAGDKRIDKVAAPSPLPPHPRPTNHPDEVELPPGCRRCSPREALRLLTFFKLPVSERRYAERRDGAAPLDDQRSRRQKEPPTC